MSKSLTRDKARYFAIRIIKLYKYLSDDKKEFVMAKQLLRSGTSIGANLAESEYAVSDADYLNKMGIALKEASESAYWLDLLFKTNYLTEKEFNDINNDCTELLKMLTTSVKSVKQKIGKL